MKNFPVVCVGGIDFVLSPEEIAAKIVQIARGETSAQNRSGKTDRAIAGLN